MWQSDSRLRNGDEGQRKRLPPRVFRLSKLQSQVNSIIPLLFKSKSKINLKKKNKFDKQNKIYELNCQIFPNCMFKVIFRTHQGRMSYFPTMPHFHNLHLCRRFCVGDKFYLCDNKILCEYDYEERLLMVSLITNIYLDQPSHSLTTLPQSAWINHGL